MAIATLWVIQALLVALSVVLFRGGTDALAERVVDVEVRRTDLRLVGGIVVAAAVLLVLGVALLVGPLHALALVAVSVLAGVGAEALARRLDRPDTQTAAMRWLERTLLRSQDLGRAGSEQATRLGRDVTSRARRAGAGRAARRR